MLEHQRLDKETIALICEDCVSVIIRVEHHELVPLLVRIRYVDSNYCSLGEHVIQHVRAVVGSESYEAIARVITELQQFWLELSTGDRWTLELCEHRPRNISVYRLTRVLE